MNKLSTKKFQVLEYIDSQDMFDAYVAVHVNEAIERCAQVADRCAENSWGFNEPNPCSKVAAAIRALKEETL